MKKIVSLVVLLTLLASLCLVAPMTASASLRTINVSTVTEIQNALKNALPGDEIVIASGTYVGVKGTSYSGHSNAYFYSGIDGTSNNHIIVRSANPSSPAILKGSTNSSGYVLCVKGDYWEIKDLKINCGAQGIILDNSNHTWVYNCEVYGIGQEGIHIRDNSTYDTIEDCNVHDCGQVTADYGEGVYIGSANGSWKTYGKDCNYNLVTGCTIGPAVTAEHVDIKEGTVGNIIEYCTFNGTGISGANYADSFIDAKGNDAIIRYNTGYRNNNNVIVDAFQVHKQLTGWGQNNDFNNNTVYLDTSTPYVVNASSGTTATASNNTRSPSGNMYNGPVTQY